MLNKRALKRKVVIDWEILLMRRVYRVYFCWHKPTEGVNLIIVLKCTYNPFDRNWVSDIVTIDEITTCLTLASCSRFCLWNIACTCFSFNVDSHWDTTLYLDQWYFPWFWQYRYYDDPVVLETKSCLQTYLAMTSCLWMAILKPTRDVYRTYNGIWISYNICFGDAGIDSFYYLEGECFKLISRRHNAWFQLAVIRCIRIIDPFLRNCDFLNMWIIVTFPTFVMTKYVISML